MQDKRTTTHNIVLAIGGLNGFVSTEVQGSAFVLRLNFGAKNPAHRQYVNRCLPFLNKPQTCQKQGKIELIQ